jgi:hypothetical protein
LGGDPVLLLARALGLQFGGPALRGFLRHLRLACFGVAVGDEDACA